jgi:hypothetical protein
MSSFYNTVKTITCKIFIGKPAHIRTLSMKERLYADPVIILKRARRSYEAGLGLASAGVSSFNPQQKNTFTDNAVKVSAPLNADGDLFCSFSCGKNCF